MRIRDIKIHLSVIIVICSLGSCSTPEKENIHENAQLVGHWRGVKQGLGVLDVNLWDSIEFIGRWTVILREKDRLYVGIYNVSADTLTVSRAFQKDLHYKFSVIRNRLSLTHLHESNRTEHTYKKSVALTSSTILMALPAFLALIWIVLKRAADFSFMTGLILLVLCVASAACIPLSLMENKILGVLHALAVYGFLFTFFAPPEHTLLKWIKGEKGLRLFFLIKAITGERGLRLFFGLLIISLYFWGPDLFYSIPQLGEIGKSEVMVSVDNYSDYLDALRKRITEYQADLSNLDYRKSLTELSDDELSRVIRALESVRSVWAERGIGFLSGVVSSILAAFLYGWTVPKLKNLKTKTKD